MLVLTRRFWFWLALGIPLALSGAFLPGLERLVWFYNLGLIALTLASKFWAGNPKFLRTERVFDPLLSNRVENQIELALFNEGSQRVSGRLMDEVPESFWVEGADRAFTLEPGQSVRFHYEVIPSHRGQFNFRDTYVRLKAPLGLCEVDVKLSQPQVARVYPNLKAIQKFDLLNRRGRGLLGIRRTRYRGIGTEFESLREYVPDDDFRRIDWKASARMNKFVIREYELEKNQSVILLIDVGKNMMADVQNSTKLDHVLDSALLLMHAANVAGDQVGLMVFSDRVHKYIAPKRGSAHMRVLLDAIHDLRAIPTEADYHGALHALAAQWRRRALVVLFTDSENKEQAQMLSGAIAPQRHRHLWFIARVKDPRLDELELVPITSERRLYDRAALSWYREDRNAARRVLEHQRIDIVESEPDGLSNALVSAYIDAKRRALI